MIDKYKIIIIYEEFDIESDTLNKSYSDTNGKIFSFLKKEIIYNEKDYSFIELQTIVNDLNNKIESGNYYLSYLPDDTENDSEIEEY